MIDTLHEVETPEGVTLQLRVAGVVARSVAWLIDFAVRFSVVWVSMVLLGVLEGAGSGIILVLLFVVYWFYPILFEALNDGRTIGKRVMGLRVLHESGAPVGWTAAIVRNLLRVVDMFPAFYGFGLTSMMLDDRFRRLGDIVAGTVVVYDPAPPGESRRAAQAPLPVPLSLVLEDQLVLQAFSERADWLTVERQQELAGLLRPLTRSEGQQAVDRLHAHANWLMGRR